MTTKETPLKDIFYPQGAGIPNSVVATRISPLPRLVMVCPNLGTEILGAVQKDIKASTDKLLNLSPLDILKDGWIKYREVQKSLSDSKQNPDDSILKPLVRHTVKSVHHPFIQLCLEDNPVWKLEFEITASLDVEGAVLKIHNGVITHVLSGTCWGNFKLSCMGQSLAETKTGKFALPGEISLRADFVRPQELPIHIAQLSVISGELAGRVFDLYDGLVVGRSSKSSIRLSDSTISRHHARLRRAEDHWFIQDLGSVIGIYVNNVKVDAIALKDGDHIRIGKAEIIFYE